MKVPASIRQIHADQLEPNRLLKMEIDRLITGIRSPRWHYESRIKELDSFALKAESGRFGDARQLEDFFACTLVVPNATELFTAEQLITSTFTLHERRPPNVRHTHKRSDAFPFDDLRLYVRLKGDPTLPPDRPPNDLVGILFEVQLKTFLQHAWTIATHGLVYKTDEANWSKERIAFQIKAMLEHAELSIQEAESLAESGAIAKEDDITADLRASMQLIRTQWGSDELPEDIRRLALNVTALRRALRINIEELERLLGSEKAQRANSHPINLSPYSVLIQYLMDGAKDKMLQALTTTSGRFKILIPQEVALPSDLDRALCRNAIFVDT